MTRLPPLLALAALLLSGCSDDMPVRAARTDADRQAFPISGSWTWADGGRSLPTRDVGCGPQQSKLTIRAHALEVETGRFRHAAFTVIEWWLDGDSGLRLRLEDNSALGRRRLLVDLDLSDAGFIRFVGATDERGRPLAPVTDRTGREIDPAEQRAMLAGAFSLVRCADANIDTASLLRGPAHAERVRVLR